MNQGLKSKNTVHPKETANIASLLTFFYSLNLFRKGYCKDLKDEDLYEVLTSCKSKHLGELLEAQWELEKKTNKRPSFIRVLCTCFGKRYLLLGLLQLTVKTILVIQIPESLGKLVSYYIPGQTEMKQQDAFYYGAMVAAMIMMYFIYTQNYFLLLTEFAIRIKTAVCSFVYRKALKMTEKSLSDVSMGKIVTMITKDVYTIEMIVFLGNDIWIGFVQTILIGYLSYRKIGLAALAGVGFVIATVPIQIFLGKFSSYLRLKTSRKTDERLQLTQELLSNIKTIKMYAWEGIFKDKITRLRRKELDAIFKLFFLKMVIIVIAGLSSKIGFYFLVMTHVWMGFYFTAEMVYFVQACLLKLKIWMSMMLPLGVLFGAEFSATSIRLESILNAEEVLTFRDDVRTTTKEPFIIFDNVTVQISKVALKNITMTMNKGLNVVIGQTGSGKTSFIKTILEEFKIDGNLTICGSLSYAVQEPWLFPSTIKHNILFGQKMNPDRYKKVLEICALNQDLKAFNDGDDTAVGDNGVNLSKGQQARINLARAVYKEANIYLLDDCLAALDGHVSDYIFKECILKFLKNKLCIFVCNNGEYIYASDWIINITAGNVFSIENVEKINFELVRNKEAAYLKSTGTTPQIHKESKEPYIYKEVPKSGTVEVATYKKYITSGGGYVVSCMIATIFIIVQAVIAYSDQLVSNWVTLEQNLSDYHKMNTSNTNSSVFARKEYQRVNILNVYTIVIVASVGLSLIRALSFFNFCQRASINLHKTVLCKVINAKMTFFDSSRIGNVLNRFSKDLCTIDEHLPVVMIESFEEFFITVSIIFLITNVKLILSIPAGMFFIVAYLLRYIYLRTGRSLQRLEAATRSPMLGHIIASLKGVTTIRAFKAQQVIIDEFDKHQDLYTSAHYTLQNSTKALAFMLDGVSSIFIVVVILNFTLDLDNTPLGDIGMAITQSFHLISVLQHLIRRWAECENQMTAVERLNEYVDIDQEQKVGNVFNNWPLGGEVTYENVSLQYNNSKILKNVNFTIKPRQKVGIVGRTGAGKSSIISTLFRLYDTEGVIKIDNVNTQELCLSFLRSNIALIPQDPVIISGTIRDNIDPYNKCTDAEIWKVLHIVNLQDIVTNLTEKIDIRNNFSAGQKQLVCLARAIIRKNKIVVMDEPTANLDNKTDCLIQNVIKTNFVCCTVIIVAHRMSSIMASDVVMVVHDGKIVEFDKPSKLLKNKKGFFFKMFKKNNDVKHNT